MLPIGVNVMNSANHETSTYTFFSANCSLTFVKHSSVTALKTGRFKWVHLPRAMEMKENWVCSRRWRCIKI